MTAQVFEGVGQRSSSMKMNWDQRAKAQLTLRMCSLKLPNRDDYQPPALHEALLPYIQELREVASFLRRVDEAPLRLSRKNGTVQGKFVYWDDTYDAYWGVWKQIHDLSSSTSVPRFHVWAQDRLVDASLPEALR